jgi:hypothetical protein
MSTPENTPQVWDDERDCPFFRLTNPLFSSEFCYGTSVLLASYDADDVTPTTPSRATTSARTLRTATTATSA